ncbi:MAG: hypothetical protein EWV83_01575 [Microcystis sp. M_OC_Ca_00000000_S217Cul]|nr:MAG: hypothetical protein EWV83_01575 [Microcystis sp. M_OC_Ca_00000000_S217Cul]TRT85865.1 MAG: hypothetical protein EWV66_17515 [Microcystis sp. M_OC_Ca_00000000_C217Col]
MRQKVRAKHSDRKSPVSPIGYAQMLRPYRTRADEDARFGSTILSKSCTCLARKATKPLPYLLIQQILNKLNGA